MSEGRLTNPHQNPGDPTQVTIALAEFSGGITGRADGLSTSPGRIRVQGLRVEAGLRQSVAIGELLLTGNPLGFRLSDYELAAHRDRERNRDGDPRPVARDRAWLVSRSRPCRSSCRSPISLWRRRCHAGGHGRGASFGQTFEYTIRRPDTARYVHDGVTVRDDVTPFNALIPSTVSIAMAISGLRARSCVTR
jgi:hypothetical protein